MSVDFGKVESLKRLLQENKERFDALQSLNTLLESCTNSEVLQICSIVNPHQLFLLLDNNEPNASEEIKAVCSVVSKMLLAFPGPELAGLYQFIELGLQHGEECVRVMTLRVLLARIDSKEVVGMSIRPTMFHLITQLLGDESLDCAKHSDKVIVKLIDSPEGSYILSSLIKGLDVDLKGLMNKNDTVRYRVFDLVVAISSLDESFFQTFKQLGYMDMLISDLETNDVLLKLNCLEVLEVLMGSLYGCGYVRSSDVLVKLHCLLELVDCDPFASMLVPGIIKFFGHFCNYSPDGALAVSVKCPLFVQFVFTQLIQSSQDDSNMGVAMETFALLGSSPKLRPLILSERNQADMVLGKLWQLVIHSQSDSQVKAMNVLSAIFSCDDSGEMLNSDWFNLCPSKTPLSVVMAILNKPFIDLQLASLKLIKSVSSWQWGQKNINDTPGLVELLLDRKSVSDPNGLELKFQIISLLANSSTTESVFGSPIFLKFKEYQREGVLYISGGALSVATDEL